jgi:hypothetical protein
MSAFNDMFPEGYPPFEIDDEVRTIKGAHFWGKVVSCYRIEAGWRVDVLAIAEGFEGTLHVYPATQLALRQADQEKSP